MIRSGSVRDIKIKYTVITIKGCDTFCVNFDSDMKLIRRCKYLGKIRINEKNVEINCSKPCQKKKTI